MSKLDRVLLRKLLGLLGSDQDGEVLNAARRVDSMVRQAGTSWEALLPEAPKAPRDRTIGQADGEDMIRLDQLIASIKVTDVLKIRLQGMKQDLSRGKLAAADRSLLRVLHRKAVIDGAVVAS